MNEERVVREETLYEWTTRLHRERRQYERAVAPADNEQEEVCVRSVSEVARIRHAQIRARQTLEERSVVQEADRMRHVRRRADMTEDRRSVVREADRMRHVRRRLDMTADQRTTEREVNRRQHEESRIAYAGRRPHVSCAENLPKARRNFDGTNDQLRHMLGQMDIRCNRCDALHWIEERAIGSALCNPKCPSFNLF